MDEQRRNHESRKILVCVDSYEDGVLKGRIYNDYIEPVCFESLSRFLIKIEELLEEFRHPQPDTQYRRFAPFLDQMDGGASAGWIRRGAKATFEIQVIFRHHTSWQGVINWLERDTQKNFRSVLELILLIDSALRSREMTTRAS